MSQGEGLSHNYVDLNYLPANPPGGSSLTSQPALIPAED